METHILEIYDENNNLIRFNKLEIKYEKSLRSSSYCNILYIDDIPVIGYKRNTYRVKYKCNCGNISECSLKYFLGKTYIQCNKCTNRNHVSKYINKNIHLIKDYNFDNYNDEFKYKYYLRHLKEEEFYFYINKIYSINHKKIIDINTIIYYPHENGNNQSRFVSKISFDGGITKENLKSIQLVCSICNKIFTIKPFNLRLKNINDIRCQYCNFETLPFKIKLYDKNTLLTYQSNLEKKFLDYCYNYKIKVINGFEIPYVYNGNIHTYISDFYLPDYKMIIEIKGNNPWFKRDLKLGKIDAKNNAANKFANEHNMKFIFILDDIDIFFKNILKISI